MDAILDLMTGAAWVLFGIAGLAIMLAVAGALALLSRRCWLCVDILICGALGLSLLQFATRAGL